jgi:hypothetical protein
VSAASSFDVAMKMFFLTLIVSKVLRVLKRLVIEGQNDYFQNEMQRGWFYRALRY